MRVIVSGTQLVTTDNLASLGWGNIYDFENFCSVFPCVCVLFCGELERLLAIFALFCQISFLWAQIVKIFIFPYVTYE